MMRYIGISILFFFSLVAGQESPFPKLIFPDRLSPGDTIMLIAPSGSLGKDRMNLARKRLEDRGYFILQSPDLFRAWGYLGGTDERRAQELMDAFENKSVKAIFPGTGGYGTTRILHMLDYDIIKNNPKILIGFSDITGLHLAIHKWTGLITFHSPNPMYGLGSENNLYPVSDMYFWKAIEEQNDNGYLIDLAPFGLADSVIVIQSGTGTGQLIGGNLSLISTLMGTPYEIETDGKILFIEDVGEAPYRIDRYLSQLKLAGKFDHVRGVILGKFTRRSDEPPDDPDSFTMMEVLQQYFSVMKVPVVANFPVGHYKYNVTLPIGVMVTLDANQTLIHVLQSPTQSSP